MPQARPLNRLLAALARMPPPRRLWRLLSRAIGDVLPKGLYARSLIIIIAPVVLLQSVIAYTFMERHWQLVTRRLSAAVTADVAALIDVYESYPQDKDAETLTRIAGTRLNLDLDIYRLDRVIDVGFCLCDHFLLHVLDLWCNLLRWLSR